MTADPRIESILQQLMKLATGDFDVYTPHQGRGDELDAILESVNMLAEELKHAFSELERVNEQLVRSEKLTVLGQLCGGVAHELRNPLGAIKNASYFLRMAIEKPEADVAETLEIVDKEIATCERLVTNLLDFARPRQATLIKFKVNDLIDQVLGRVTLPDNVALVKRLAEDLPPIVADPEQLGQAFGNLVLNSIQAMDQGGKLRLETRPATREGIEVVVADTGRGIKPENLQKVFEPLFTTKAKGIGLGLAVTRTIFEKHGGAIHAECDPGVETRFVAWLPTAAGGDSR
jgi:signal transduction histidine kinase